MLRTAIKLIVSGILIYALLRNQDLGALFAHVTRVGRGSLSVALVFVALMVVIVTLRWSVILRAMNAPLGFRTLFPIVWVGQFFSQALPSAISGDVMRVWLAHKAGIPASSAVSSVVVDRVVGLSALLLLTTLELPWLMTLLAGTPLIYVLLVVMAIGYMGIAAVLFGARLPASFLRFRVAQAVARVSRDVRATLWSPRFASLTLGYGIAIQLKTTIAVFALTKGLELPIGLSVLVLVVPLASLVQAVPISIGGWGVREGYYVAVFGMLGLAAAPDALALSVLYGLLNMVVALPGAAVWLMQYRGVRGETARLEQPAGKT